MHLPERLLIPYGAARLSRRFFEMDRDADGRERVRCRIAHVVVEPARREPLRLSDAGRLVPGPAAPRPDDAADRVSLLRAAFEDLCGLWWPAGRRFVAAYFALASSLVEEHRRDLRSRLAGFGALYDYRDWLYSAPAPLPRAWIPVAGPRKSAPSPESFVASDFAFWIGDAIVAAYVTGTETVTSARLRDLERLRRAGMHAMQIPAAAMEAQGPDALRERLPRAFLRFWEGERYPSGPSWTGMADEIHEQGP